MLAAALERVAKQALSPDLVEVNELAAELAKDAAGSLITGLSKTKRRVVANVIAKGIDQGWSDTVLQARIAEVVGLSPRDANALENARQGLIAQGLSPGRVSKQVAAYQKRLVRRRAAVIAQHEVRKMVNDAQRILWLQQQHDGDLSPYAVRVVKINPASNTCPICKAQNGRRHSLKDDYGPPVSPGLCLHR